MFLPSDANCHDSIVSSGLSYSKLELACYNLTLTINQRYRDIWNYVTKANSGKKVHFCKNVLGNLPGNRTCYRRWCSGAISPAHEDTGWGCLHASELCQNHLDFLPLIPFFPCDVQAQRSRSFLCRTSPVLNHDPHLLLSQLQPEVEPKRAQKKALSLV